MRAAHVINGVVVNIIVVSSLDFPVSPGYLVQTDTAGIGDIYNGVVFTRPEVPIATARLRKSREMRKASGLARRAGFTSSALGTAYFYSTDNAFGDSDDDEKDAELLQAAVLKALIEKDTLNWTISWPCSADGGATYSVLPHTSAQMRQVGHDGLVAMQAVRGKLRTKLAEIAVATTVAQVEAVVW